MLPISFNSVLIIAGISVFVPVVLGLLPRLPVPGAVLEVILGIVVGPSVLGWARVDAPVEVLSTLGLGMLLFLAGLEIDVDRLRGPLSRLAGVAFAASAGLGFLCALLFWLAGQATPPILLGIILMSTSAGLLLPLLKDAGEAGTEFGQLIMTAAALAEIVPILLLSLFFSASSKTVGAQLASLAIFLVVLALIGLAVATVRRLERLDRMLEYLSRRSAQLRVRATLTLALGCGVLAYQFGFASILGAFAAGLLVRIIEISGREPNREFLIKLEGIGFGFLIPIFFIATGVAFQLKGLLDHPAALAEVPLFLVAILFVRGVPALFYARSFGRRYVAAGGLLQATTLTFVIVATEIGLETGKLTPTTSAALVAAGLLSAAVFPAGAARLLARGGRTEHREAPRITLVAEPSADRSGSGMSVAAASQLDAADPLARFRTRFVAADDPSIVAYLDGNSLGRPLAVTGERLARFVAGEWGRGLIRSWDEAWMAEPVAVGDRLAEVALGAAPGQVIVADSTTVLLYKLIRAGVGARPGRDEVLIDRGNFPTDRFVVAGVAAELGLSVRYLSPPPATGVRPVDVAAALSERTALVVLSHVAYRSGFLADMAAITGAVHDAGALILWDLCHSVGALPVELDAGDVDLAAGCTYKYLNGGPGSPAFGYVATRLHEELRQPVWGWMGASDPFAMAADYRPAKGIRKFISGTPPVLAMQPLKDMLELIAEAGLGAVRSKSVALTEHAIALADELLVPLGAVLASPRAAAERGGHVTVDHPRFAGVTAALWERGVIPDFRPPDGIRIGLSPLSTSFAELERGVEAIAAELRKPG